MKPIIMGADSVRAILEGRKTQTRRVVKADISNCFDLEHDGTLQLMEIEDRNGDLISIFECCPYGKVGDRLWVRETVFFETFHQQSDEELKRDGFNPNIGVWVYRADNHEYPTITANWTSPMFMPRKASRITLEITDIRVERVQDITEDDAIAEGCSNRGVKFLNTLVYPPAYESVPIAEYANIWQELNAKRGYPWEKNPWVWCIGFKRVNDQKEDV